MRSAWMVGVVAALCGGCSKKSNDAGGGGGGTSGAPAAFAAWMPKDAVQAWQGAWASRLMLRTSGTITMAGDPVALEITGAKATAFDGKTEHALGFAVVSPCVAELSQTMTEGSMKGGTSIHDKMFLIDAGALVVGSGAAGYRKGKAAIVCSEGVNGGTHLLDEAGTCTTWATRFGKWESKPTTCTWSQVDGKDVLTIGSGDWAPVVTARGDLLESDQFRQYAREGYHQRAADYAAAKATTAAMVKAKDPGEIAKAAGGKVGETDTIASLQASYAADKATLTGKPLEITALYLNANRASSGGTTTHNVILVDAKDATKITLTCTTAEAATGLTQWDRVTAKGTIGESFGVAALDDCTVTKLP